MLGAFSPTPTNISSPLRLSQSVRPPACTLSCSFFLLRPEEKTGLSASLGSLIASSPLEALIIPGDPASNNSCNRLEVHHLAILFQVGDDVTRALVMAGDGGEQRKQ